MPKIFIVNFTVMRGMAVLIGCQETSSVSGCTASNPCRVRCKYLVLDPRVQYMWEMEEIGILQGGGDRIAQIIWLPSCPGNSKYYYYYYYLLQVVRYLHVDSMSLMLTETLFRQSCRCFREVISCLYPHILESLKRGRKLLTLLRQCNIPRARPQILLLLQ